MHLAADMIERKFFPVCCKQPHGHMAAFYAFSSMYASFHAQSCAMCQAYMQIGYSDAPDIVINYRKSKGHVNNISTIYCSSIWLIHGVHVSGAKSDTVNTVVTVPCATPLHATIAGPVLSPDHVEQNESDWIVLLVGWLVGFI